MSRFLRDLFVILGVGAAVACGSSGGPSPASLTGAWAATKAELVDASNPATQVDLVTMGGTVRLVLNDDASFVLTVDVPGQAEVSSAGTWSSSMDELTLSLAPPLIGEMQFDMSLNGDTLQLDGGHMPFDVNGDHVVEEAIAHLTLLPQP